tara:strand:- start:1124 stop:1510 length:387 start_codon:yes stop_codon:yes gene_type:complete
VIADIQISHVFRIILDVFDGGLLVLGYRRTLGIRALDVGIALDRGQGDVVRDILVGVEELALVVSVKVERVDASGALRDRLPMAARSAVIHEIFGSCIGILIEMKIAQIVALCTKVHLVGCSRFHKVS